MRRFASVLAVALALPLTAQTLFGPAKGVSEIRSGFNANPAFFKEPRVTPGDNMFLVTWTDFRASMPMPEQHYGMLTGAAMRLDAAGRPLDESSLGLPLLVETVVWTGKYWIAIGRDGYVRINREGILLDRVMRRFETPIRANTSMYAAWTGGAVVVATHWAGSPTEAPRVYARTFDGEMRPLGEHVLRYTSARGAFLLGAPSDGNSALVLYEDYPHGLPYPLFGARFDRAGNLVANDAVYDRPTPSGVEAGAAGGGYMLVVGTAMAGMFRAVLIGHDNRPVGESSPFGSTELESYAFARTLPWDGSAFTSYWVAMPRGTTKTKLYVTRIGSGAEILTPPTEVMRWPSGSRGFHTVPAAAAVGRMTVLAVEEPDDGGSVRAWASPDPLTFGVTPPVDLLVGTMPQETPAAASSATQSLIVWREKTRHGPRDEARFTLFASRVSDAGDILDPKSIALTHETCYGDTPLVGSNGRDFLVVWSDRRNLYARSVRADGAPGAMQLVGPLERCGLLQNMELTIGSNGTDYLLAWRDVTPTATRIYTQRLGGDGHPIDVNPLAVGSSSIPGAVPRVSSDGTDYLVAYGNDATLLTAGGTVVRSAYLGEGGLVEGVWWNGASYSAWVRFDSTPAVYRLLDVARDASTPLRRDALPAVAAIPAIGPQARSFTCRAGSCIALHGKDQVLRIDAKGNATVSDIALVSEDRLQSTLVGVSVPMLVYVARMYDMPLGGVPRVLFRTELTPRGRAVRK